MFCSINKGTLRVLVAQRLTHHDMWKCPVSNSSKFSMHASTVQVSLACDIVMRLSMHSKECTCILVKVYYSNLLTSSNLRIEPGCWLGIALPHSSVFIIYCLVYSVIVQGIQ